MIKHIFFILVILFPACASAQLWNDSSANKILHNECEDKIFTKVEILPSFKKGIKNFEDTLNSSLNWSNIFISESKVTFKLIVTPGSHLLDIKKESGNIQNEVAIKETLILHSLMWKPAIQNGRLVCAYVRLDITFLNGNVVVALRQ